MDWLAPVVLKLAELGPWGPVLFILLYIAAAVTLAPAFFLTVAAGALFGVWRGSVLVFIGAVARRVGRLRRWRRRCRGRG